MNTGSVDYLPILLQIAFIGGFVSFVLVITHYLGPRLKSKKKDANWECGIESEGDARFPVSIRYFMTAILFVLFPYAVNFKALELEGLLAVVLFVALFLTGFFYVLKKGALEWEK